jgi:regulator of RNase E activity RraA
VGAFFESTLVICVSLNCFLQHAAAGGTLSEKRHIGSVRSVISDGAIRQRGCANERANLQFSSMLSIASMTLQQSEQKET